MAKLSASQIYALARGAGLGPAAAVTATGVALAESGGDPDAQGDVNLEDGTWGPSVGLWQIRSVKAQYGTGQPRDASKLTDPQFNAASMASISGAGKNFSPWTTYTSGKYKQYVTQGASAAISAGDNPASSTGNPLGEAASSFLNTLGFGSVVNGAPAAGLAASSFASGWAGDVMKIGLYLLAAGTGAALIYAGAKRAVTPAGDPS